MKGNKHMITKQKIESGIREHLIKLVKDPNMDTGTVCKIGDWWFYFDVNADDTPPEKYLATTPIPKIVNKIFKTLNEFKGDEETKDEYDYYDAILTYRNGYSS